MEHCESRAFLSRVVLKTEPSEEVYRSRCLGLSLGFISFGGFAVLKADMQLFVVDMNVFDLFTK